MGSPSSGAVVASLEEVLVTDQLALRPARAPDHAALNRALLSLNREIALHPEHALQRISELACELCHADSAGISVLDEGEQRFRWQAVAGPLRQHLGQSIPQAACPCNAALASDTPVLLHEPERHFPILHALKPHVNEALLMSWSNRGKPIGTLWLAQHQAVRQFDAEDARVLRALADLASCAWQVKSALDAASDRQGELARIEETSRSLARGNADLHGEVERRRQVESALRAHEARLSAIIDSLPVGVGVFETDGSLVLANPEMLRYMPDRRIPSADPARTWRWSAVDENGREIEPRDYPGARALRGERVVPGIEMRYLLDDGRVLWTQVASVPIRDQQGHVTGQVGVVTDMTEFKRATLALRESEGLFRALAEGAPALIWRVDAEGRATFLNRRYQEVTGRSNAELMGNGWHSLLHPDDAAGYLDLVNRALHQRTHFQGRVRVKAKDGSWRWYESCAAPLFTSKGEYDGQVGLSIDIDDAVKAEEVLKEADRRKDIFLATLAHELRNPLAPIANGLHLLRNPDGRRSADRIVEIVERQVNQLTRLVDDLMEVSRITRGKLELRKEPVRLDDIIHAAVEISEPGIRKADHELELVLPQPSLMLDADMLRLTQVFANLLNNAARYTDSGGHIRIAVQREGDQAVISVSDNGIGIAPDQLPRVFDLFAQVRQLSGPHRGGLGIGLTMVRSLVEMHGGTVQAKSPGLGQGCEFTVRLPLLAEVQTPAPQPAPHALPNLAGQRVLAVDDNHDAANTLAMMLGRAGAQTRAVYDGPSALAALPAFKPHIVILDIGMPGMDGYELARSIREIPQFRDIKIFSLSGWGQETDRLRARSSGIDHHLTKPLDLERLHALLAGEISA